MDREEGTQIIDQETILVKGAFWTYIAQFIMMTASLLTNIVLARLLDKENWGIFSVVISFVSLTSSFSDIGFNYTIQHKVASSKDKRPKMIRSLIQGPIFYKLVLIIVSSILFLVLAYSGFLSEIFKVNDNDVFVAGALFYFSFNLFGLFDVVFIGLNKFKGSSLLNCLFYIGRLLFSSLFVIFGLGVSGAVIGITLAFTIAIAIQVFLLRRYLSFGGPKKNESFFGELTYGLGMGIASVATGMAVYTDSVMVGLMLGPVFVGFYRIGSTIALASAGTIGIINKVLFPLFSRNDNTRLQFNKAIKYALIFAIPACIGLCFMSDTIVTVFFGKQYLDSSVILMILSYLIFDASVTGILISYLAAKKHSNVIGYSAVITLILNVIFNFVFITYVGFIGAAIASVLFRIIMFLFLYSWANKAIGLSIDLRVFVPPFVASLFMILILFLFKSFFSLFITGIDIQSIIGLLVYMGIGTAAYFVAIFPFGFNLLNFSNKFYSILRS